MTVVVEDMFGSSRSDPVDPGWDVDELLDIDPTELDTGDTLDAIRATAKAEAMLHASRLELMHRYRHASSAAADVIAAHTTGSIGRAATDLTLAETLLTRLPETFALLKSGRLDRARAWQVADATMNLTDEHCAELERRIYPRAVELYPRQLRVLLNRTVTSIDADAARNRARAARAERRVAIEPANDGMAWLNAYLPAADVCAIWQRVDAAAHAARSADGRSTDQQRADALRDLVLGTGQHSSVRTHVYVTATAETLLGLAERPGELRGVGPLPAEQVRDLAYQLSSVWSGVLVDEHGVSTTIAARRYRFSGRLAEYVRLRDGACTYPACTRPTEKCDINHRVPYPAGPTTADNGDTLCRRHHRMNHESDWTVRRRPDGTIVWIHPNGIEHVNRPSALPVGSDPPPPSNGDRHPPRGSDPPPF